MLIPKELLNSIISGDCVLFLGAGASRAANAPSANDIKDNLCLNYLDGKHREESLSRVAGYIEAKPGFGRNVINEYISNQLSSIKPSNAHLLLPEFNWNAIYTTNYDLLIERTYDMCNSACKSIISSYDLVASAPSKSNQILLYKPHGCLTRPETLVITDDDYFNSVENRKAIFSQLLIHKYRNTFLFIGYSFSDYNLSKIWFDVIKEAGRFSLWSYALWPDHSEEQKSYWLDKNVILLNMTFEEFMKELKHQYLNSKQESTLEDYNEVWRALLKCIEAKSPALLRHSFLVARIAMLISQEMGLQKNECDTVEFAALFHDLGYLKLPDSIFENPAKLTLSEFELIKKHPLIGESIIATLPSIESASQIIRHHHEYYNGSGYPDGLSGEDIPLLSRIIATSDAFASMVSERSFRKALSFDETLRQINCCSGLEYDPKIVAVINRIDKEKLKQFMEGHNVT